MGQVLKDRVAVVTGSGQGIGRAIAIAMAREGARVVTNNRKRGSTGNAIVPDALLGGMESERRQWLEKQAEEANGDAEATAHAIKAFGGEATPFFGDISDFNAAAGLIRTAVDAYGRVDILVNVAGTFGFNNVWEITEETWDRVTNTKPKGYFNVIRFAVPHMIKQKWGRIINCTSRAYLGDVLKHAEYCTANAGVVGLTKAVAKELFRYGITCNAFSPFARTRASFELDAVDKATSAGENPWMDRKFSIPLEMTPSPEHVAPFIVYLATEEAARISGSVFQVAGNGIGLYSEPEIARSLVRSGDEPWTIEELMKQAPRALFMDYHPPADVG
jgi:3-oxoacyl-[acyl-carrier protein] reductase